VVKGFAKPGYVTSSYYLSLPQQMKVKLCHEQETYFNIQVPDYGVLGYSLASAQGTPIGGNVTYPGGMRQLHTIYQKSIIDKVHVGLNFVNQGANALKIVCCVMSSSDYDFTAVNLNATTYERLASKPDSKTIQLQSNTGGDSVRQVDFDVDCRVANYTAPTDAYSTTSVTTGSMTFPNPANLPSALWLVVMYANLSILPGANATFYCKNRMDFSMTFSDMHILQQIGNL